MFDSRAWLSGLSTITAICLSAQVDAAVTMTLSSATVQDSADPARLCVGLVLDDEYVAGTGNLIRWDGACTTVLDGTCTANPAHGKDLYTGEIQEAPFFSFIALVINVTNLDPIPAGDLYCCDFAVQVAAPGECCEVRIEEAEAADWDGNSIEPTLGAPGQVCLASDAGTPPPRTPPTATSTPSPTAVQTATASPVPTSTYGGPTRTSTPEEFEMRTRRPTPTSPAPPLESDDGCVVAASDSTSWLPWLSIMALLALRKRRVLK